MNVEDFDSIYEEFFAKLGEHADAIQVMASFHESSGTACRKRGIGNYYARLGMAHEFIDDDRAHSVGQSVAQAMPKGEE